MREQCLLLAQQGGNAEAVVVQDAQSAEVQAYFSQWGPVNSCQLAHNDSALIALISRQGPLQVPTMHIPTSFAWLNASMVCLHALVWP